MRYHEEIEKLNKAAGRLQHFDFSAEGQRDFGDGTFVHPEVLAAKLAAIRNAEYPSLFEEIAESPKNQELLWFLQFLSFQPGGLRRVADQLCQKFPERIGTETMRTLAGKRQKLTVEERQAIYNDIPWGCKAALSATLEEEPGYDAYLADTLEEYTEVCTLQCEERLHFHLRSWCHDPGQGLSDLWCFQGLLEALHSFKLAWENAELGKIAETQISKVVFKECNFASSRKVSIFIKGVERIGKTTALEAFCRARPGRARLVRVPSSNDVGSLYRAVGKSLGIDDVRLNNAKLKVLVEYVFEHSGLMLCADEAQFLWPRRYTENTKPARLDWVRTEFMDKRVPVAIVMTPQELEACQTYEKRAKYRSNQFYGRNALWVELPGELDEADIIAVTKVKFPALPLPLLKFVAAKAMRCRGYLHAVKCIMDRAEYYAEEDGRTDLTEADVRKACDDITVSAALQDGPGYVAQKPISKNAAMVLQAPENEPAPCQAATRVSPKRQTPLNAYQRGTELETLTADA